MSNAPPPLPPAPRPSPDPLGPASSTSSSPAPAPRPAVTPPPPAPSGPIRDLEALFRELVVALQPAIPAAPATPSDVGDAMKSLVPMNTEQLEILRRTEETRKKRVADDERDRDFRRIAILVLTVAVLLIEGYRAANPGPAATTTIAPVVVPIATAPAPATTPPTTKAEPRETDVARDR